MRQKRLSSFCLALLAAANAALASVTFASAAATGAAATGTAATGATTRPDAERTERSITLAREGADWPLWSGPAGNLTSLGNGLFDGGTFGLEQIWSRPLGSAYSGILVVDGRLVTTVSDGASDYLVALDASSGTERWRYRISDTYKGAPNADDGPLSTPTVEGGVVYGLGSEGELFAVDLEDGTERWRLDLAADFGAVMPGFGFTTAPTVLGDLLVVETGGDKGRSISAFERESGALRWSTGDDSVTHQSPLVWEFGGETSLVAITDRSLLGLAPETGEVLWQHQHTEGEGRGFTAAQPVTVGETGILLIGGRETALFQVDKNGEEYTVEEVWRSRALRSQGNFATPVPYEGYLYGFSGSFLTCVNAATGEMVWKSRPPGIGNLVLIDGYLVILVRSGEIVVAEATPEGYEEVSRIQALERGYFTRPSFAGGTVYVRNLTDISAIGVTQASSAPAATASRNEASRAEAGRAEADWDLRGDFGVFVRKLAAAENKSEMVERFLAEHPTLPILEGPSQGGHASPGRTLVHFVYHGEVEDLAISGNFLPGGEEHPMHRVDGTDFYFRSYELPENAVFSYRFSVFDERMTDPRNPRKTGPKDRQRSLLATAGWQPPSHLREPEGKRGSIEKLQWKSQLLDNERELQVYLPPGYSEGTDRYPLLVVNDAGQAISNGEMDKSLDNLIGETVAPIIVAFVSTHGGELGGLETDEYTRAQVEELIPLLDETFRTDARRESRAVLGQDFYGGAGFAAMYLALHYPETISRAAAQSYEHGALEEDLWAAAAGEKHDLELVFHWSSHDRHYPFWDFDARRDAKSMVAALEKTGYRPKVIESDDGFGWGMWQGRMAEVLEALFPLR
ncbi:MAG: PQQ-binding-like beta-propeller repeat protein [Acidobacteriota bacterium]